MKRWFEKMIGKKKAEKITVESIAAETTLVGRLATNTAEEKGI